MNREKRLNRLGLVVLAVSLGWMGCATGGSKVRLMSFGDIPAAQGTVTTAPVANGNTALKVQVKHLASPERVSAGATTYVVWMKPAGEQPAQNVGALRVDENLTGTLNTITAYRSFEVFITAEPTARLSAPTGETLLSARIPLSKG